MTTREFSVPYRAPNIVDVVIPKVLNRTGYRLKAAANFDGSFVQLFEMTPASGFLDPGVDRRKLHSMPGLNHIRAVFDPDTFDGSTSFPDAGIAEGTQFWMTFQPVDSGAPGTETDPVLILTHDQHKGHDRIVISGDAPSAADISGSLTLCLPRRMRDFTIVNLDDTDSLFVAFDPTGPEFEILPETTFRSVAGAESTLTVRGGGSIVAFSASFTVATPQL